MATNNLITVEVKIRGIRPFLYHHFTTDALNKPGERKTQTGTKGNDPEEWRRTVLVDQNGRLYILPTYFFGCIRNAGSNTKVGAKGTLKKALGASLQVLDMIIYTNRLLPEEPPNLADCPDAEVYIYSARVKNPGSGGSNIRHRVGMAPGWECAFSILWDGSLISMAEIQKVLEDGGSLVGVGDGRSIGFGRFEIVSVETK